MTERQRSQAAKSIAAVAGPLSPRETAHAAAAAEALRTIPARLAK
jgi:hypothetical protein